MNKIHRKTGANRFERFRRDECIQTTALNAEQALTRDTVPVNVAALMSWNVHDAQKAALATTDPRQAIDRVAQTSLRETIGSSTLAALLRDRQAADLQLCEEIGRKADGWGVTVRSVEIRDVAIPAARQAENDANLLGALGLCLARHRARAAEAEIAGNFVADARIHADRTGAVRVRRPAEGIWARLKRRYGISPVAKGLI